MSSRKITPVQTMQEKQLTYTENMQRWKKAMQQEFYFEAIMIDYATMEDRLFAFLYYSGMINDRNKPKVPGAVRPDLMRLLNDWKGKEQKQLRLYDISGKIDMIHATLKWAMETDGVPEGAVWLRALKDKYEDSFDVSDVIDTLGQVRKWCDLRNEVVHGLMNKQSDKLNAMLPNLAEDGMALAREMDAYVKQLKKGASVRRAIKLHP